MRIERNHYILFWLGPSQLVLPNHGTSALNAASSAWRETFPQSRQVPLRAFSKRK
jgi:hypothetical protein